MGVNIKYGLKRIDKLISKLKKSVGVEDVLKNMRGWAIKLEKGHNEAGILISMVNNQGQEKGRLYATPEQFMANNSMSYLYFEYFGTGSKAELPHIGHTQHFIESGFTEWFIPVGAVDKPLRYPIITIQGGEFYIAHGVAPNHFLEDAEFKSRVENGKIVESKINQMIREVCK